MNTIAFSTTNINPDNQNDSHILTLEEDLPDLLFTSLIDLVGFDNALRFCEIKEEQNMNDETIDLAFGILKFT